MVLKGVGKLADFEVVTANAGERAAAARGNLTEPFLTVSPPAASPISK